MSRRKGPKKKRSTQDYIETARKLTEFAPALAKYKRRKTLKPSEKAAISRKANLLRFTDKLIPVNKKQAKLVKDFLYVPEKYNPKTGVKTPVFNSGVRALRLANTGPDVKILKIAQKKRQLDIGVAGDSLIINVRSNNRPWIYETVPQLRGEKSRNKRAMRDAATQAFITPENLSAFDAVIAMAKRRLKEPQTVSVHLYTKHGRVGEGFRDIGSFVRWLDDEWMKYRDTEQWVFGLAIQLGNVELKPDADEGLDEYNEDGEEE